MQTKLSKAIISSVALTAILLVSGIISTGTLAGKQRIVPHKLTIFFTGDDRGSLKACG